MASTSEDRRAKRLGAGFNGSTAWDSYMFVLHGTANPNVTDYGIWPFLDEYTRNLKSPLGHPDLEAETNDQKKIVLREVAEKTTGQNAEKTIFRLKTIFGIDHPETIGLTRVGGTADGMRNTSTPDLEDLSKKLFIPEGTTTYVYTQSPTRESNNQITDKVVADFSSFPNSGTKSLGVDKREATKLNPDFHL